MGAAGGYISGGPIYQRNKALFLQQRGWSVYYISCCHGKIYISGLEDFIVETCTSNGGRSNRNWCRLYCLLGRVVGREIKGRHIITLLDEYNDKITSKVAPFYKFKYGRKELACISDEVMIHIFSSFIPECKAKQYSLVCYCSNQSRNSLPKIR